MVVFLSFQVLSDRLHYRSDLDYLLISLLERMKHVVAVMLIGIRRWLNFVVVISERAVSDGLGSGPIIISFSTSLHSPSSRTAVVDATRIEIVFHLILIL